MNKEIKLAIRIVKVTGIIAASALVVGLAFLFTLAIAWRLYAHSIFY